jgi:tetratricopeptide (TPR) repeat protein
MNEISFCRKRVTPVALVLICIGATASLAAGQFGRSSISGMVFDERRSPVRQIPVELLNDLNSVIQRTKTDGSGRYVFRGISSGRYIIRVLPLGTNLEEQSQEVEIAGIGANGQPIADNLQVDIRLRVRRSPLDSAQATGVIFVQDVPAEAQRSYDAALLDLESNRVDVGKAELEAAIKIFPKYYLALVRLAYFYIDQKKLDDAVDVLARAVDVNERSFAGWYGLGFSAYLMDKLEPAVVALQNALAIDKNSINAHFILGLTQRRLKKYDEAERSLLQAKKLDNGKTGDVYWNLALLYANNLKRYKDAADELETYLKIEPDAPNKASVQKLIKRLREKAQTSN